MLDLHEAVLEEFAAAQGLSDIGARLFDLPKDALPPPPHVRSEAEAVLRRRAREALAQWSVPCPGCGEPVYSTPGNKPRQYCSRRCNHRVYYERHRDAAYERTRRWRERNPEQVNAWARKQQRRRRAAAQCDKLRALLAAVLRDSEGELGRVA